MLLLRGEWDLSRTTAGLYAVALAAGATLGGALFPRLSRWLSPHTVLSAGLGGLGFGVLGFCVVNLIAASLLAIVLSTCSGILVISGVAATLTDRHGPASAGAISEANALGAGMGLLAPLLVSVAVMTGIGWRAAMVITALFAAGLAVTVLAVRPHLGRNCDAGKEVDPCDRLGGKYWLAWTCLLALVSVEICLALWTPDQLTVATNLPADKAAAGMTAVLVGMVIGRLAGGKLAVQMRTSTLLYAAIGLALAGFLVFWAATEPLLAFGSLLLCGLGVGLHFPLDVSIALDASDSQHELAMSRNAYAIAIGFGAVPFLLGALADRVGINLAFGTVPFCLLIAFCAVRKLVRRQRGTVPAEPRVHRSRTQLDALNTIPQ